MRGFLVIATLLIISAAAVLGQDTESIRIVTTGQIRTIDARKKTLEFWVFLDSMPPRMRRGGRGRRGGSYPAPPPTNRGGAEPPPVVTTKVFITQRTVFRKGDGPGDFAQLRIGQRVTLTGVRKGKSAADIEALEIATLN
jgi:hypothetical protein